MSYEATLSSQQVLAGPQLQAPASIGGSNPLTTGFPSPNSRTEGGPALGSPTVMYPGVQPAAFAQVGGQVFQRYDTNRNGTIPPFILDQMVEEFVRLNGLAFRNPSPGIFYQNIFDPERTGILTYSLWMRGLSIICGPSLSQQAAVANGGAITMAPNPVITAIPNAIVPNMPNQMVAPVQTTIPEQPLQAPAQPTDQAGTSNKSSDNKEHSKDKKPHEPVGSAVKNTMTTLFLGSGGYLMGHHHHTTSHLKITASHPSESKEHHHHHATDKEIAHADQLQQQAALQAMYARPVNTGSYIQQLQPY